MPRLLVTGAAGFIGSHLCARLLARGDEVLGVDALTEYYDPALKRARLARLSAHPGFRFEPLDVAEAGPLARLALAHRPAAVVHLAGQVGVRQSTLDPAGCLSANLVGFGSVLEAARQAGAGHLVFASSSSVYGAGARAPLREDDAADRPISLYGATKRANELMAHAYAHLHGLRCTGLRFFTVYGPWGRPDMAPMLFARRILAGEPLELFDEGRGRRDFTYVDDAVEVLTRVLDGPAAPYRILNVGQGRPEPLGRLVELLERHLGRPARRVLLPARPEDMQATEADPTALEAATGYRPATPLEVGVERLVAWHRDHYR